MMEENAIIEEIRRMRDPMLAGHLDDLDSLVSELQRQSEERAGLTGSQSAEQKHSGKLVPSKKVG